MSLKKLWQLLSENGMCVAVLAGCSFVFLCCGGNGVLKNQTPPELKSMAIRDIETTTNLPDTKWLEFSDGYLFWAGAMESITTRELTFFGQGQGKKVTINALYVPLVSKATFDNWQAVLAQGGGVSKLPYDQCRVLVKIDFGDLSKKYPRVAAALSDNAPLDNPPEPQLAVQGVVHRLDEEPTFVNDSTGASRAGFDSKHTLVLVNDYGINPAMKTEINRILSILIAAFGLLLGLPLAAWTFRRLLMHRTAKRAISHPNDAAAQGEHNGFNSRPEGPK
jgi:hypothetical protein